MIVLTGDTHGEFDRIADFCTKEQTKPEDILIILGDAGFNYYGTGRDRERKAETSRLPITVFCIHGNHENRPDHFPTYQLNEWHGGAVWAEPEYPNILFAKDGEIYDIGGLRAIVIGGAYSVDKPFRLARGYGWWEDEQPSPEIKARVEAALQEANWNVDVVLSHTAPLKYEPRETFSGFIDQSTVDKSTEKWLDSIEERLTYKHWFCGHYHVRKRVDRLQILYENYVEWPSRE